ncbi:spermidine/putrescine ABC transporter permease [Spiroplasma endosymbiont of Crioceris asparagi]|uniref:spermidine/putrescine ABC transporter permease n=1 Tax=Spiroplasma endosymbiont of Crioceris asparagi TaxID=3066286 RepID=UPI0030D36318
MEKVSKSSTNSSNQSMNITEEISKKIQDIEVNILEEIDEPKAPKKTNKIIKFVDKNFISKSWAILAPFFFVMIFLIILPIIAIVVYSIVKPTNDATMFKIRFDHFTSLMKDGSFIWVLFKSLFLAFIASMVSVVFAYPIALILASLKSKTATRNIWILVTLPIWINMILKTIGLKTLFLLLMPSVFGTPVAIVIGMVYMFLPFAIAPIYNALEKQDKLLVQAAYDLKASRLKTFWEIIFRYSIPGVITAFSLVLIQASTTLLVVSYLGDGRVTFITSIIESYFLQGSDFGQGSAIAVVLAIVVLFLILVLNLLSKTFESGRGKKWKNLSDLAI